MSVNSRVRKKTPELTRFSVGDDDEVEQFDRLVPWRADETVELGDVCAEHGVQSSSRRSTTWSRGFTSQRMKASVSVSHREVRTLRPDGIEDAEKYILSLDIPGKRSISVWTIQRR